MVLPESSESRSCGGQVSLPAGSASMDRCSHYQKHSGKQGEIRNKCPFSPAALILSSWGLPMAEPVYQQGDPSGAVKRGQPPEALTVSELWRVD